jgi:hypothetical protein
LYQAELLDLRGRLLFGVGEVMREAAQGSGGQRIQDLHHLG